MKAGPELFDHVPSHIPLLRRSLWRPPSQRRMPGRGRERRVAVNQTFHLAGWARYSAKLGSLWSFSDTIGRLIGQDPSFSRWVIKRVYLVEHVSRLVTQRAEAMGKALWNPQYAPVHVAQLQPKTPPIRGRVRSDIDSHIPNLTAYHANELALSGAVLVMEPAQRSGR